MQVTRWNKRRIATTAVCVIFVYWVLSASHHTYEDKVTITTTSPETIWEYVADFQNMQMLNPTM